MNQSISSFTVVNPDFVVGSLIYVE